MIQWLKSRSAFGKFSRVILGYSLLVIVWGAYVRATGSGAGCGDHWPLCNGEVLPRPERIQTVIEFLHRASSGLSLILVVLAYFWSRFISAQNSWVRRLALLSVIAIIMEALLGAGLVLLKLVEFDQSVARAISISLHLVNTLFLVACLATQSWLTLRAESFESRNSRILPTSRFFWGTACVFLGLGVSGAITALGDTLFPASSLSQGMAQDFETGAHFLKRLRVIHPILALTWIGCVFAWSSRLLTLELKSIRAVLLGLVLFQFFLGFLNWVLMAPNGLQLIHLLVADFVFIAFWISGISYEARKSSIAS